MDNKDAAVGKVLLGKQVKKVRSGGGRQRSIRAGTGHINPELLLDPASGFAPDRS